MILYLIKLPRPENPGNIHMWHMEHWTAVSTLLGLISSAYRDLHHKRSNKQPENAETELLPMDHQFNVIISTFLYTKMGL